jgi:hypothetical protein
MANNVRSANPRHAHEFEATLAVIEARLRDESGPVDRELLGYLEVLVEALRIARHHAEKYYGEWE